MKVVFHPLFIMLMMILVLACDLSSILSIQPAITDTPFMVTEATNSPNLIVAAPAMTKNPQNTGIVVSDTLEIRFLPSE